MRFVRIVAALAALAAAVVMPAHASPAETSGGARCLGGCGTAEELEYSVNLAKGSTVLLNTVIRGLPGRQLVFRSTSKDNEIDLSLFPDGSDPSKVTVAVSIADKASRTSVTEPLVLSLGDGRLVHADPWIVQVTRMPVNADR